MKVLSIGFFNKGNLGDELFKESFKSIFPSIEFTFVDKIQKQDLDGKDAIFFGGGSFLDGQPAFSEDVMHLIAKKKVFYLGVGSDTEIHPWHKFLLKKSQFVACRSPEFDNIRAINSKVKHYPDLVYALSGQHSEQSDRANNKSILILPNALVSSKWDDPSWKHNAWEYFKSEFSQFIDELTNKNYKIDFFPMCRNSMTDDQFVAIEIINKLHNHSKFSILPQEFDFKNIYKLFSRYDLIISQRFHGLILADMFNIPCINIHHHNKLKNFYSNLSNNISYYNISKNILLSSTDNLLYLSDTQKLNNISIKQDIFEDLRETVLNIITKG